MIQRAFMSFTTAWIFALSVSAVLSGAHAAFVRRSGSSGGTAGKQRSTEVYIGNVIFLWPGFLTLLQICCATPGRSLYSPECFFLSCLFLSYCQEGTASSPLLYSTRLYKQLGSPSTSITLIMIGRRAPIRNISLPFSY